MAVLMGVVACMTIGLLIIGYVLVLRITREPPETDVSQREFQLKQTSEEKEQN